MSGTSEALRDCGRSHGGRPSSYPWLLLPAIALLLFAFLVPVLGMAGRSVTGANGLSLEAYLRFLTHPVYLQVLLRTFRTAAVVTLLVLVLAYPVSYLLNLVGSKTARILTIAVVVPFFTSIMVRTYAWMVLLGRRGIINEYAQQLGLTERPLDLLYTEGAVLVGMTYVLLPYMILTLYSVMRHIDPTLMRAAQNLGAGGLEAFRRVFLPLTLPGMVSGSLLVFILGVGFFITPALMGGPGDALIATLINREIELATNWAFGSAMAVVLLATTLLGFLVYYRLFGLGRLLESKP